MAIKDILAALETELVSTLEQAQTSISDALVQIRTLTGAVEPAPPPATPKKARTTRRKSPKRRNYRAERARTMRRKETGEAGRGENILTFSEAAKQALSLAKGPLTADDLIDAMRKLGWTTSSQHPRGLVGTMMPTVQGVRRVAPMTYELIR